MNRNRIIILALIAVVAVLLVGLVAMTANTTKEDAKLTFKSNSTLARGDSIEVALTGANGTALANRTVNVTLTDSNKTSDYHSVVTNNEGIATLKVDKDGGNYTVTVSFVGDGKYNGCNATQKITVEEAVEESQPVASTASSDSSTKDPDAIYYDSQYNIYYDSDGIIIDPDGLHGQGVGGNYYEVKEFFDSGKGMD